MIMSAPRLFRTVLLAVAFIIAFGRPGSAAAQMPEADVVVDGQDVGRQFDGVGAVSAGASSRLLFDYPEPERSQILDYLFEPGYGAALQILKVEIGSDVNSTDGSEPSHMREPGEVNCSRGYEWWLMKEAKERNPDITLAGLAWGAPGWMDGFWSESNIDYHLAWLGCAEQHGLEIDYMGGWNERGYDADWFVKLGEALEQHYPDVEIIATDNFDRPEQTAWSIVTDMRQDPALKEAVDVVGVHFECGHRSKYRHCSSTETAREVGEPLWMSENSAMAHDAGAGPIARAINRMYIDAKMTGYISWPPISAWYANLPIGDTGLMVAEWPWSGYYDVGKSIWVYAHTTQFTEPGWHYLDTGSRRLDSGATVVSLVSPSGEDYSMIIEAMDVEEPATSTFHLENLPEQTLRLWMTDLGSDDADDYFRHAKTLEPADGTFSLTLRPDYLYTVSTVTSASKGTAQPEATVYEELALPFQEGFEDLEPGELARFFSDINGAFEAAPCGAGRDGMCYRQMVTRQPIRWNRAGLMPPTTMVGDPRWWGNYTASTKVLLDQPGYVELIGRISGQAVHDTSFGGYHLQVGTDGWRLYSEDPASRSRTTLASGDATIDTGSWHEVALEMSGNRISAYLDGERLTSIQDTRQRVGNVALRASAWQNAQFDDVKVTPIGPAPHFVPHEQMSVTASSARGFHRGWTYEAPNAIDDRPETRWQSEAGPKPHVITLDLGDTYDVQALTVRPRFDVTTAMITEYRVEVSRDGRTFRMVAEGTWPATASTKVAAWRDPVPARYVRLVALEGVEGLASASEIHVVTAGPGPGGSGSAAPGRGR